MTNGGVNSISHTPGYESYATCKPQRVNVPLRRTFEQHSHKTYPEIFWITKKTDGRVTDSIAITSVCIDELSFQLTQT